MTITALVVWPISITLEIDDDRLFDLSKDEQLEFIREELLDNAGDILANSTIHPIIQDCSNSDLID